MAKEPFSLEHLFDCLCWHLYIQKWKDKIEHIKLELGPKKSISDRIAVKIDWHGKQNY